MSPKRKVHLKKIHRSAGAHFVLISKQSVEELGLKAQDENCQLIEYANPVKDELVFKVMRLGV